MSQAYSRVSAVFDIETERIGNPYEVPATSIAIVRTDNGQTYFYDQERIREGVEHLLQTPSIVGYNSRAFDIPVLLKYVSRGEGRKLRAKPHFDIFYEFQQQNPGQLISLANFAKTTLGMEKFINEEASPIILFKTDPRKLMAYNIYDTRLTYLLYLEVVEKGYIEFTLPVLRRFYPEVMFRTPSA